MIIERNFLNKLKAFGLNSYEAKIWTALLSRGVSNAGELSDISNVPRSRSYDVLENLGSEFDVLYTLEPDAIKKDGPPLLDIAISRMRSGEIDLAPGYDGKYGKVKVFKEGEKEQLRGEQTLFAMPAEKKPASPKTAKKKTPPESAAAEEATTGPQQMDLFAAPEADQAADSKENQPYHLLAG